MPRRDTKSDAIRRSLAGGGLTFDALRAAVENRLRQVIGRHKLRCLVAMMKKAGDVQSSGPYGATVYSLTRKGRAA